MHVMFSTWLKKACMADGTKMKWLVFITHSWSQGSKSLNYLYLCIFLFYVRQVSFCLLSLELNSTY